MSELPLRLGALISHVRSRHPDDDALAQLTDAVGVAERITELGDHLIGHFVDRARHAGASWTDIGASMGVTKQAAQKRFVPRDTDEPETLDGSRFGRFTSRARRAVVGAQQEARQRRHDRVGTEHVVLGLLAEPDGLAARAIGELEPRPGAARAAAEALLGPSSTQVPAHIPFTPRAKKAMDLTVRTALRFGHNYIGTEHLLLGVLAAEDDLTAAALIAIGITSDRAEEWIIAALAERVSAPHGSRR